MTVSPLKYLHAEYGQDFHAWLARQIALLKQGQLAELDVENLAEELESMGRRDRREVVSHFVILILHLLKWQCQALQRSSGWRGSIVEQRYQAQAQLEESPSLSVFLKDAVAKAYPDAVKLAIKETGLNQSDFPAICPYTVQQLLDDDFFPETEGA